MLSLSINISTFETSASRVIFFYWVGTFQRGSSLLEETFNTPNKSKLLDHTFTVASLEAVKIH